MTAPVLMAVCTFYGVLHGDILFHQKPNGIAIDGQISGLSPSGRHGFHVHEKAFVGNNCTTAGAHYNPFMKTHGAPDSTNRHVGDLGNIKAQPSGEAIIDIWDTQTKLDGPYSVIGRSLVVHEKPDDLGKGLNAESLKTGNAGSRIDCCIIKPKF